MGSGNFLCVVLASTVDDDNLVGNPFDGTQSARQVVFLVQRNQTNGETTHHPPESLDSALVSHNRRSADLQQQEARRLGGSEALYKGGLFCLEAHSNQAVAD